MTVSNIKNLCFLKSKLKSVIKSKCLDEYSMKINY